MKNNIIKKNELSIQELFYFMFLTIMFMVKGFGLYDGQLIYKILFLISFLFISLKLLFTDYSLKEWIVIILLGILVIIINRASGEKGPLIVYAILVGMKDVSLEKCMRVGAWSLGLSFAFLIILNLFMLPNSDGFWVKERFGIFVGRWSLGYPHPNTTAVTYLAIVTLILFLLKENYNIKYFSLLLLGNILINMYCVSFTGIIVCTLYLCVAYLFTTINVRTKMLRIVVSVYSFFCMLVFMIVPFVLPKGIMIFLEKHAYTLYHRLILSKQFFDKGNIYLWGIHVTDLTDSKFTLDNSYLYSIVFNGVVFSVIVFALYLYVIQVLLKEKRYVEILLTLALMTEGIMEPFMFNTSFKNISLFIVGAVIWEKINRKRQQEKQFGLHFEKYIYLPAMNISWSNIFEEEYQRKMFKRVILLGIIYGCLIFFLKYFWLPEYVLNSEYVGINSYIQFFIEYVRKVVSWLIITEAFCVFHRLIRKTM